jgi:hypothetical protein
VASQRSSVAAAAQPWAQRYNPNPKQLDFIRGFSPQKTTLGWVAGCLTPVGGMQHTAAAPPGVTEAVRTETLTSCMWAGRAGCTQVQRPVGLPVSLQQVDPSLAPSPPCALALLHLGHGLVFATIQLRVSLSPEVFSSHLFHLCSVWQPAGWQMSRGGMSWGTNGKTKVKKGPHQKNGRV